MSNKDSSISSGSFVLTAAPVSKRTFQVEQEIKMAGTTEKMPIFTLRPLAPNEYANPRESTHCVSCKKEFGFFRGKKSCSTCGLVYCGDCCGEVRGSGSKQAPMRMCQDCLRATKLKNDATVEEFQKILQSSEYRTKTSASASAADDPKSTSSAAAGVGTNASFEPVHSSISAVAGFNHGVSSVSFTSSGSSSNDIRAHTIFDFVESDYRGRPFPFARLRGRFPAFIVMNVASQCAFTDSGYAKMLALREKYKDRGLFSILVPSNEFKSQEPGSDEEVAEFACKRLKSGGSGAPGDDTSLVILKKACVNGPSALPLYQYLKRRCKGVLGEAITWNFVVFVVNGEGRPVDRFLPTASAEAIEKVLVPLLPASAVEFQRQQAELAAEEKAAVERAMQAAEQAKKQAEAEDAKKQQLLLEQKRAEQERKFRENEERFLAAAKQDAIAKERERQAKHAEEAEVMRQFLREQQQKEQNSSGGEENIATSNPEQQQQKNSFEATKSGPVVAAAAAAAPPAPAVAAPPPSSSPPPSSRSAAHKGPITQLTDLKHFKSVMNGNNSSHAGTLYVVRAAAAWCTSCNRLHPDFVALAEKLCDVQRDGVAWAEFDCDEAEDIADSLGVEAMPAVFGFRGGNSVFKLQGGNHAAVVEAVERHRKKS